MIRLIQRRLIIPRGDTGSFSIPVQYTIEDGDIAVFALYDTMYQETVLEKRINLVSGATSMEISFNYEDTASLTPKKYLWDIKIYKAPILKYKDSDLSDADLINYGIPISAANVHSYYAAYKLPICEIKEVAQDV